MNRIDIENSSSPDYSYKRKYRDQNIIGPIVLTLFITLFTTAIISSLLLTCFRKTRQRLGVIIGLGLGTFLHGLLLLIITTSLAQAWCRPGNISSDIEFCNYGKWIVLAAVILEILGGVFIAFGSHFDTKYIRIEERYEYHTKQLIPMRHR